MIFRSSLFSLRQRLPWPWHPPLHRGVVITALAILLVSALIVTIPGIRNFLTSSTALRDVVRALGPWAPVIILLYYTLQIVIAPIPGQAMDVTLGYTYGFFLGGLLALAGVFLGTTLAIAVSRRYGHPFVKKFITSRRLHRVEETLSHRSRWFFLVLFLIPGTPVDLLCLLLGLTRVPFWQAVLIANLGRMPLTLGSVLLGATDRSWSPLALAGLSAAILLSILFLSRLLPRRWQVLQKL